MLSKRQDGSRRIDSPYVEGDWIFPVAFHRFDQDDDAVAAYGATEQFAEVASVAASVGHGMWSRPSGQPTAKARMPSVPLVNAWSCRFAGCHSAVGGDRSLFAPPRLASE